MSKVTFAGTRTPSFNVKTAPVGTVIQDSDGDIFIRADTQAPTWVCLCGTGGARLGGVYSSDDLNVDAIEIDLELWRIAHDGDKR